jgi:hypothetical protein
VVLSGRVKTTAAVIDAAPWVSHTRTKAREVAWSVRDWQRRCCGRNGAEFRDRFRLRFARRCICVRGANGVDDGAGIDENGRGGCVGSRCGVSGCGGSRYVIAGCARCGGTCTRCHIIV